MAYRAAFCSTCMAAPAAVRAGRGVRPEDCRGAGEPLLEVLVTVLALWGLTASR